MIRVPLVTNPRIDTIPATASERNCVVKASSYKILGFIRDKKYCLLASDKIFIPNSSNWFSNKFLTSKSVCKSESFTVFFLLLFTSATSSSIWVSEDDTTPILYIASILARQLKKRLFDTSVSGSSATYWSKASSTAGITFWFTEK